MPYVRLHGQDKKHKKASGEISPISVSSGLGKYHKKILSTALRATLSHKCVRVNQNPQ